MVESVIRKIEQAIKALESDAVELLDLSDQLMCDSNISDMSSSSEGRLRLSRRINGNYRAWCSIAWPLLNTNLAERIAEFDQMYNFATTEAKRFITDSGLVRKSEVILFAEHFSVQMGFVRAIPRTIEA